MFKLPAIPDPLLTVESLRESTLALKEAVENLGGIRGPATTTAAREVDVAALLARITILEKQTADLYALVAGSVAARSAALAANELRDIAAIIADTRAILSFALTEPADVPAFVASRASIWTNPYVANRRRTLMFIGDSITWGYGVNFWEAYPKLIQQQADTKSTPVGNTDEFVARNVHADDIVVIREVAPNIRGFKLAERSLVGSSITYDNAGPFQSDYVTVFDPSGRSALLFNSVEDSFFVTPTSATVFITLMVKVTGSAGSSITIGVQDGTATINLVEQNVPPIGAMSPTVTTSFGTGVYRLIFAQSGATTPTSTFLVRCTAAGGATARILTVNPTNSYPSSNYIGVQINARGSYAPEDYSDDVGSILETIIHPAAENGNPNTHPIFVLALGTVSIYSNTTGSGDRRRSPSTFQTNLNALVTNLKAAAPNSPIVLTNPPIPGDLATWTTTSPRADYDAAIANVAATHNLFTVDLRNTVASNQYLDGIHPNANGHIALANKYIADLLI